MDRPTLDDCIEWMDAIIPALKNVAVKVATLAHLRRLKAVEEALIPARDELCRSADLVEHCGYRDQAARMRRQTDVIRATLTETEQ